MNLRQALHLQLVEEGWMLMLMLVAVQCSSGPGDSVLSGLIPQGVLHWPRSVLGVGSIATVTGKFGRHDDKFE
ncbi:hypothetical protein BDP81DRAFT_71093 [Colletotrichum phormii]|uniref:Secreted protein n=1 Tax=Colletotrichum phormii TaxID=359342 RepID=A0AAI9ZKA5_9PEZI|nr:uncharacterized protein BDP81DRAFT_71093 [Colletotrichum phormii]KAK1633216.1 hypothetical protein BDP81DRAFT_71093 [Colletotrichum phormii]